MKKEKKNNMSEVKEYFVVYAKEEDVVINGSVLYTIQKIYNGIEYCRSVKELLDSYYCSNCTLINFWKIGDVEDEEDK